VSNERGTLIELSSLCMGDTGVSRSVLMMHPGKSFSRLVFALCPDTDHDTTDEDTIL